MLRSRARRSCVAVFAVMAGAWVVVHGQNPAITGFSVTEGLGNPAADSGALHGEYRSVAANRMTLAHGALRTAMAIETRMGSAGVRYARGRILVKFRDGAPVPPDSVRPDYADFNIVRIDPNEDAEAVASAYRARDDVEYAQPAYVMHPTMVPNDPHYKDLQWNFPLIDIERAWDIQPQAGSNITVAVIDTGMAYTNATITTNILGFRNEKGTYPPMQNVTIPYSAATQLVTPGRIVAPHDFVNNTSTPLDFDGHGTHVSGTIGQLTNDNIGTAGIAFNVKLMPLKVICSDWDVLFGTPASRCGTDDEVAQAIRYAADNGAKVINMSIGRDSPDDCGTNRTRPGCAPAIEDAMNYAVGKGVFISIAGGNEFSSGNPTQVPAEIASRIRGAVSVASIDNQKNRASYSSTGSWIELAAPGGGGGDEDSGFVWQQTFDFHFTDTFDLPPSLYRPPRFDVLGYVGEAGTSQATPHVSGVAAMLIQQGITSPAAVEDALEKSAVDLGAKGRDNSFGFGLIDARKALLGLGLAR
jgi:serine protease